MRGAHQPQCFQQQKNKRKNKRTTKKNKKKTRRLGGDCTLRHLLINNSSVGGLDGAPPEVRPESHAFNKELCHTLGKGVLSVPPVSRLPYYGTGNLGFCVHLRGSVEPDAEVSRLLYFFLEGFFQISLDFLAPFEDGAVLPSPLDWCPTAWVEWPES